MAYTLKDRLVYEVQAGRHHVTIIGDRGTSTLGIKSVSASGVGELLAGLAKYHTDCITSASQGRESEDISGGPDGVKWENRQLVEWEEQYTTEPLLDVREGLSAIVSMHNQAVGYFRNYQRLKTTCRPARQRTYAKPG